MFPLNRSIEESNMLQNLFGLPSTMHSASIVYKDIMELQRVNTENLRLIWQTVSECEISRAVEQ